MSCFRFVIFPAVFIVAFGLTGCSDTATTESGSTTQSSGTVEYQIGETGEYSFPGVYVGMPLEDWDAKKLPLKPVTVVSTRGSRIFMFQTQTEDPEWIRFYFTRLNGGDQFVLKTVDQAESRRSDDQELNP